MGTPVASPNCGPVRTYLSALASGNASAPAPGVWEALAVHGAVSGTPSAPTLTPVGRHVLAELQLRAYRTDAVPLDRVAGDLSRVLTEFDTVVRAAEYFLQDLGPVVPTVALPLLRPVSLGLANRRETPEELASEFRAVWGGVEVMGGDPRDRLLAAELLNAASADMSHLYSPIMNMTDRIREKLGPGRPSIAPATILQMGAGEDGSPSLDGFLSIRTAAGGEEAAALLVAGRTDATEALAARDRLAAALGGADAPSADARHAATFLVASRHEDLPIERIRALADHLGGAVAHPLTAAALLAEHVGLSPEEIVDWHTKAVAVLTQRQLAPTPREIGALAIALLHGLPDSEFLAPTAGGAAAVPVSVPALTAIHAWMYRPLLGAETAPTPSAGPSP